MSISYVPQNQNIERERERVKRWFLASCNKSSKSFTLVELLIVIGILAALASTVVVVINPTEMLRQGRDSTRMRELGSIHRALSMFQIDRPTASIGYINTIHISIPDTSATCANLGLPAPPPNWAYRCVNTEDLRRIDGNGWIPVNFTTMFQGSPLSHLPIDPTNTAVSSNFYVYVTDGRTWVLASLMESERHIPSARRDGGTDFARFEAGNNLALWTTASGLVGYWSFDEGTGTTARDLSGRGNTGTLQPTLSPPTWTTGRVGGALSFDGVNDFVNVGAGASLNIINALTIEFWAKNFDWPSQQYRTVTWKGRHSSPPGWGVMTGDTRNNYGFYAWIGGVWTFTNGPALANLDAWNHIVFTYDRTDNRIRIYYNGALVMSPVAAPAGGLIDTSGVSLRIGYPYSNFFHGLIDEVRIYNRALTEAEVRANFNATR